MIEEGLEVPELPTFDVDLESDSDSSSTATDRKYFVCVFNISLWGGGNIFLKELWSFFSKNMQKKSTVI